MSHGDDWDALEAEIEQMKRDNMVGHVVLQPGDGGHGAVVAPMAVLAHLVEEHDSDCSYCCGDGDCQCGDEAGCDLCSTEPGKCCACFGGAEICWEYSPRGTDECGVCRKSRKTSDVSLGEHSVYLCVHCLVGFHRDLCGCDIWKPLERLIGATESHAKKP